MSLSNELCAQPSGIFGPTSLSALLRRGLDPLKHEDERKTNSELQPTCAELVSALLAICASFFAAVFPPKEHEMQELVSAFTRSRSRHKAAPRLRKPDSYLVVSDDDVSAEQTDARRSE